MRKESTAYLLRCYIWLADLIYSAGYITREEINRKWYNNDTVNPDHRPEIPERTFHNWKDGIQALFQINIKCDRAHGRAYCIEDAEDMERGSVRQWLINTFAVNNLINESHHLKHQILFEKIPSGQCFLTPLIEAMRDKNALMMTYQSFFKAEPSRFMIFPYCVKVFKQRWYLLAKSEGKDEPRIYSLDRIQNLDATDRTYKLPHGFDAEVYFSSVYGVSGADDTPEDVDIKVSAQTANYIRTLPLHTSQREMERNGDYSIFHFFVVPTFEFTQELRTHGADLEVLSPEWLRNGFAIEASNLNSLYNHE